MTMFGPFPLPHNYTYDVDVYPKSIVELQLNAVSAAIRNKPDWHTKRLNPDIVAKWEAEAIAQHITPAQFKYVMDELSYYDKLRDGLVEVADVNGVWKAPRLFPPELCAKFSRMVASLTDITESEKDWHPGSNKTVLDIVHPGIYLFVSGRTRTISLDHADVPNSVPTTLPTPDPDRKLFTSADYQWIPTPVAVDKDGKVTFLSYINNLHPERHKDLYDVLADMFSRSLPLLERVLTFLKSPRSLGPKLDLTDFQIYEDTDDPEQEEGEDYQIYDARWEEWYQNRPINPIPIPPFVEPSESDPPVVLRDCRLQVIVKIQEIHLTPEKPVYEGGVWHVEGMENERIVATAIYYYHCSNITECKLSFRQAVGEPNYEQNDERGVRAVFGLSDGEPLVQTLGSVVTKCGLMLAWPNVLQHRVSPFELLDKTKPGKRGILVFFLVDPDNPMRYDSQNVQPQQRDWWLEKVDRDPTLSNKLPKEVRDLIYDWVDDPMPLKVAREHRQRSMDERKFFVDNQNEQIYEREFSLCEH